MTILPHGCTKKRLKQLLLNSSIYLIKAQKAFLKIILQKDREIF